VSAPAVAAEAAVRVRRRLGRRRAGVLLATIALVAASGFAITLLPGSGPGSTGGEQAANASGERGAANIPAEADLRFKQAVIMLHAKEYEHAATALHKVLALAPTMPEAHVNMGYAMIGLQRYEIARDFFRSAIALRVGQANAHYGLALCLAELGDRAGAISAMNDYRRYAAADDRFVAKANAAIAAWQAPAPGPERVAAAKQ
jgi:tetratricopeptide (TPR) repeat protein